MKTFTPHIRRNSPSFLLAAAFLAYGFLGAAAAQAQTPDSSATLSSQTLLPQTLSSVPITTTQTEKDIVVDNGLVALTFSRQSGQVTSIVSKKDGRETVLASGKEAMYWDCNTEPLQVPADTRAPKKGYSRFDPLQSVELRVNTPERAEVVVTGGPGRWLKFQVEAHWVLFRGDSGFYSYAVFHHAPEQEAAKLWQTRFVIKTVSNDLFDTHVIGDSHITPIPRGPISEKVMDATYRMADGSINTKYANSMYWAKTPVYGVAGKGTGLWSVSASPEYYNGGPIKQGQSAHDSTLLRVLQSVHFGASPVVVQKGEAWSKVYGPFFTYINSGGDAAKLWADAKARQKSEAAKWPYQWVTTPEYSKVRGTVTGRWHLNSGTPKQGGTVILAPPGESWEAQGKGYEFFTSTTANSRFTIPNVIPGNYTLYLIGADQPWQWSRQNVRIEAGQVTNVGDLTWKPVTYGRTLWQIGTFDRTAGEFRNGDDARHYEMFKLYPLQFPNDVDFTIGKSNIKRDWNYAQWSWFSKSPTWKIRFNAPQKEAGTATLTFGFASAQPIKGTLTNLQVKLNGQLLDTIHLPKTGTAGYRGGVQDSQYNVKTVRFDARLLKPGQNVLSLGHAEAQSFSTLKTPVEFGVGQVMYDAIRLEIAPAPLVTARSIHHTP